LTTHEVYYAARLPCQNLVSISYSTPEILQFYNFASLAGKCLTTPPFWGVLNHSLNGSSGSVNGDLQLLWG